MEASPSPQTEQEKAPQSQELFESPSKVIAKKKRDLNKPFFSKISKAQLQQTRLSMLLSSSQSANTLHNSNMSTQNGYLSQQSLIASSVENSQ